MLTGHGTSKRDKVYSFTKIRKTCEGGTRVGTIDEVLEDSRPSSTKVNKHLYKMPIEVDNSISVSLLTGTD
jgi:hypothetical protein